MVELTRNGLLFVTVIVAAGLLLMGMLMFPSGEKDSVSNDIIDTDTGTVDVGQNQAVNMTAETSPTLASGATQTAVMTTETPPETSDGLKLLKKIGPIELSLDPIGIRAETRTATNYREEKIEVKDCIVRVVSNSITEPTVLINRKNSWNHDSGDFCVLVLLRNENGEIEKSLCKLDEPEEFAVQNSIYEFENTHEYYYSKTSMMFGVTGTKFAVSQRGIVSGSGWENVKSWEVLVYG